MVAGVFALALALTLSLDPLVSPAPSELREGPQVPGAALELDSWLHARSELRVHADTSWSARRIELIHGGWLWLLSERFRGVAIAGARLALRVGPKGELRQVIGSALTPELSLAPPSADGPVPELWWPGEHGLIAARIELTPITFGDGVPRQQRRILAADSGELLASEELVEELDAPIRGWPENPLSTPELTTHEVPLAEMQPLVLLDGVFQVMDCNYSEAEDDCEFAFSPSADEPGAFPADPPALEDAEAHRAWDDPYAGLQFMHYAARAQAQLSSWGWDPYVWEVLDCSWQQTESPADCRVQVRTNIIEGGAQPYAGAYYTPSGVIGLGQGYNADLAYDGDVLGHELGHHVIWSFGAPLPSPPADEPSRLMTDRGAISEGSADLFAWLFGRNDLLFDYFSTVEPGPYRGPRTRDVSLPFRCPQNIVGEIHMDGRIWVSALVAGMRALEQAELASRDDYVRAYLGALAAIRQLPKNPKLHLPAAREILLDELELSFGAESRGLVEDIFDARGLGRCDYMIELREEPSIRGEGDEDPLDARFMLLRSHLPNASQSVISEHPYAPPVQHLLQLEQGERGVVLRYRPGLWRAEGQPQLRAAALVKQGEDAVSFSHDEQGYVVHDAQLRFESEVDPESAAGDQRIVIEGLEPGRSYVIALVSLSTVGTNDDLVMEQMRWQLLSEDAGGTESGEESGDERGETGSSSGEGAPLDGEHGCSCRSDAPLEPADTWLLALFTLLLGRGLVWRTPPAWRSR